MLYSINKTFNLNNLGVLGFWGIATVIPMEVAASKALNYNLGVKLIRGAYMNEERNLAAEQGYESPIWEDIESTHKCYNYCMQYVIENMKKEDMVFVASHNVETCDIAKRLATVCHFYEDRKSVVEVT